MRPFLFFLGHQAADGEEKTGADQPLLGGAEEDPAGGPAQGRKYPSMLE